MIFRQSSPFEHVESRVYGALVACKLSHAHPRHRQSSRLAMRYCPLWQARRYDCESLHRRQYVTLNAENYTFLLEQRVDVRFAQWQRCLLWLRILGSHFPLRLVSSGRGWCVAASSVRGKRSKPVDLYKIRNGKGAR
jgi:hypothetical protein